MTHPHWLLIIAFAFALLPLIIGVATAFLKVSIVLGMLRSGLGSQTVPSSLVVMAISVTLSAFIMGPVFQESFKELQKQDLPIITGRPDFAGLAALYPVLKPWKDFMLTHAGTRELAVFTNLATEQQASTKIDEQEQQVLPVESNEPSFHVLLPAFMVSELKEAFMMAFVLLLPFLVIDLIVSNILVGLGMYMLSPVMISLPLKLVVFVTADGWLMLSQGLIKSYQV